MTNMKTSAPTANRELRPLHWWEVRQLEHQGCSAIDWTLVKVSEDTDLDLIRSVRFRGKASLGPLQGREGRDVGIYNAELSDVKTGRDVCIRNVACLSGAEVEDGAELRDTGTVEFHPEADCGLGVEVAVLDETGSRTVRIYPGMSAQVAMIAARHPRWNREVFSGLQDEHFEQLRPRPVIGRDAVIRNVKYMSNVMVGPEIVVDSAHRLVNGMIVNNAGIRGRCLARVGAGVDAENFIIEDGVADGGSYLRNCYIGQGAVVDKRFTAHDSLIFANCGMENGEACAVFAGPYTVTMHKSTLLIGSVTSFMNAGSGTNESNHMYKLGPVHWGVMERGVKTSSGSYIMWAARIGAFSLLMGPHKNHPDSSEFPFSYLFGDAKGATTVVPAKMLKSIGLHRDELKWPNRDRRQKRKLPMHDRIHYAVLNPVTVEAMLRAIDTMTELMSHPADDDLFIRHKGMKMRATHLERAQHLYRMAIAKYLHSRLKGAPIPEKTGEPEEWVDVAGQFMPRRVMRHVMEAESIDEMEAILNEAYEKGDALELEWIGNRFGEEWRKRQGAFGVYADDFDAMVEEDRQQYLETLKDEAEMLEL